MLCSVSWRVAAQQPAHTVKQQLTSVYDAADQLNFTSDTRRLVPQHELQFT
jgi:hypothetical protein